MILAQAVTANIPIYIIYIGADKTLNNFISNKSCVNGDWLNNELCLHSNKQHPRAISSRSIHGIVVPGFYFGKSSPVFGSV